MSGLVFHLFNASSSFIFHEIGNILGPLAFQEGEDVEETINRYKILKNIMVIDASSYSARKCADIIEDHLKINRKSVKIIVDDENLEFGAGKVSVLFGFSMFLERYCDDLEVHFKGDGKIRLQTPSLNKKNVYSEAMRNEEKCMKNNYPLYISDQTAKKEGVHIEVEEDDSKIKATIN